MKKCRRCKKDKQFKSFYKHKKMKDGFLNYCKECTKKRIHGFYLNNREKCKAILRKCYRKRKLRFPLTCLNCYKKFTSYRKDQRCCSRKCYVGPLSGRWKGGRRTDGRYWFIKVPFHPFSKKGYVLEHRLVMEKKLGRLLRKKEVVHHINSDPRDNRIENLQLLKNNSEHTKLHWKMWKKNGGSPVEKRIENFNRLKRKGKN